MPYQRSKDFACSSICDADPIAPCALASWSPSQEAGTEFELVSLPFYLNAPKDPLKGHCILCMSKCTNLASTHDERKRASHLVTATKTAYCTLIVEVTSITEGFSDKLPYMATFRETSNVRSLYDKQLRVLKNLRFFYNRHDLQQIKTFTCV